MYLARLLWFSVDAHSVSRMHVLCMFAILIISHYCLRTGFAFCLVIAWLNFFGRVPFNKGGLSVLDQAR